MADRFLDPEFQANFEKAMAPLNEAIGETKALIGKVDRVATKVEAEARRTGVTEEPALARTASGETTAAIEAETAARTDLNRQIERTIGLRDKEGRIGSVYVPPGGGRPFEQTLRGQMQAEEQAARQAAQAAAQRDVPSLLASPVYMEQQAERLRQAMAPKIEVPQERRYTDYSQLAGAQVAAEKAAQANRELAQAETMRLAEGDKLNAQDQQLYIRSEQQAGTLAKRIESERQMAAALQQSVLYGAQADDSLRRHGALTTEFINAAARGQVTLREFGTQVGQTIGKFSGWTAAAVAVYGVIGAVDQLYQGAIEGNTGVGQLQRTIENLNTNKASAAIIGLAQDTITPIKDAGDAMFAFSRTFHNVDDAAYTAGLALRAYKLDGVSLTDQVKAMTAIHQQFGVTAQGMGGVYDELAAGQRLFNARITDQIPLLARSASAVKNAGGNLQQFIELSTIALRTTGLSGAQLGTMFTRSAATFIKKPSSQEVLRQFGLDPNERYDTLLFNALQRAATLSGEQRRQLSQAIFGPLLGARGAGLLGAGPDLIKKVRDELEPGKVKGSFLEEFAKFADTSRQKLNQLKVDLEAFGTALGQSGILAPLGLLVAGLDDALKFSTRLLQVWQGLPGLVKDVAGAAALAFGTRAITQRVGLTGVPFFGRSAAQVDRAQIEKGIADEQEFYQSQYRGVARQGAVSNLAAQNALIARNQAVASGTMEEQIRAQKVYESRLVQAESLETERAALEEQTLFLQQRNNRIQKNINEGMGAQAALAQEGVAYRLGTLAEGMVVAGAVRRTGAPPPGGTAPGGTVAGRTPGGVLLPVGPAQQQLEQEGQKIGQATEANAKFVAAMGDLGTKMRGMPGAGTAVSTISMATAAIGTAATGVKGFIGKIGGFWGALTAFFLVAGQVDSAAQEMNAAIQQANQALDQMPQSFADIRTNFATQQQAIQKVVEKENEGILAGFPILGDFAGWLSNLPGIHQLNQLAGTYNKSDQMKAQAEELKNGGEVAQRALNQAESGWRDLISTQSGRAQEYSRLQSTIAAMRSYVSGASSPAQGRKVLHAFMAEEKKFYEHFQAAAEVLPLDSNDVFKGFRSFDLATVSKQVQALSDKAQIYGVTPQITRQLVAGYQYVASKYSGRHDETSLQQIGTARQAMIGAVQQNVQNLQQLAQNARTPQAATAYVGQATAAVGTARQALRTGEQQLRASVAAAGTHYVNVMQISGVASQAAQKAFADWNDKVKQLRALIAADKQIGQQLSQMTSQMAVETALTNIQTQTALRTSRIQGITPEADIARKQSDLAGLRTELAKARRMGASYKTISDLQTQINNAVRDLLQAHDQNAEQLLQSQNALATSRIQGSSPEAQQSRARSVLQGLRNLAALHVRQGADQTTRNSDQAAINDQVNTINDQATQNARSLLEAQSQLAAASIGGSSPEANIARMGTVLSGLRQLYALDRAHHAGQLQLVQDLTAIASQEQSLVTAESDNARAIAAAQGEYQKSLITGISPAAVIARLRVDIANAQHVLAVDEANGAGQAAILSDKADLNNKIEALNEQIRSDAEAKSQALYTLAESRTQDPVARARIELNAANKAASDALKDYGKDSSQYLTAQATVNDRRAALKDAIVQGKENDIQFQLDLGRISVQTAIDEYKAILRMHHLTKATRQQILEQIHQLQTSSQTDFGALNLGTIRLPTPYEIRAGLLATQRGRNPVAPQTNHFNVTIHSEAGANAFWAGADRHISGAGKSIQRAAGVR